MSFFGDIAKAVGNGIMIAKYDNIVEDKFKTLKDKLDSYEVVRDDLDIEKVFEDFKQITLQDYDDTTRKDGKNDQMEIRRRMLGRKIGNTNIINFVLLFYFNSLISLIICFNSSQMPRKIALSLNILLKMPLKC